jgi:PAS domain-containing protein
MWIGSNSDVHEMKQLQEAFRHSEEYFRGLMQNMQIVVWTNMPDGTIDFVNRQWLDMTGQSLEFVRSRVEAWMVALHPDDRERAGAIFLNGVRSGEGFTMVAIHPCCPESCPRVRNER